MDAFCRWAQRKRGILPWFLGAALAALVALAMLLSPIQARADGGGWPTATWTPLPTWTPSNTPIPTLGGGILFPPTPTFTPPASGMLQQNQQELAIPQAELQVQLTEAPASRSLIRILCWPLGILAVLLLFLGVIMLRNRIVVNR